MADRMYWYIDFALAENATTDIDDDTITDDWFVVILLGQYQIRRARVVVDFHL